MATTKLILTHDVPNLGHAGEVVEVKAGYARNYLVPRGFAAKWTAGAQKQIDQIAAARRRHEIATIDDARVVRDALQAAVVEAGCDFGVAYDGDADRCLACDEKGQEIDGDKVIALLAMNMKEKGRLDGNTAVVTVMSNLGFIKFMESQGIHTEKTAVGDRYVLENMRENGYAIGGEQSGHVILLHHATTGDGELTAGKLLKLLAESGKKMSELNGIYAQYPQVLVNVVANAAQKAAYKEDKVLADFIENEQQKLMDMGRVLVRVSGTEPKIRVMVEGQDLEAIDLCAKRIVDKINERIIEG